MTEKEKALAYDKALERARNLHKDAIAMGENLRAKQCEIIFPELKESKDERIRKWLIGYFRQYKEDGIEKYANGLKVESILAWLEKQGDTNETINRDEFGIKGEIDKQEKSEFEKQFEAYMYHPETDEKIIAACCKKLLELAKKELMKKMVIPSVIHSIPYFPSCFEEGGACINPHHDCINCPKRNNTGGFITTTNNYGK